MTVPAPLNSTSMVTGLVTPFRVRSPTTVASLASSASTVTERETKVAVGYWAVSKKSAVCR